MIDERLFASLAIRTILLVLATVNLYYAGRSYRHFRDARGLRGFVAGLGFLSGVIALSAGSQPLAQALPDIMPALRIAIGVGVTGFVIALSFSVYTWRNDDRLPK